MLDLSGFSDDFRAVADRWAFERLLRTNRNFRLQRVARMIAAREGTADNLFATTDREVCAEIVDEVDNIFA